MNEHYKLSHRKNILHKLKQIKIHISANKLKDIIKDFMVCGKVDKIYEKSSFFFHTTFQGGGCYRWI